MQTRRQIFLLKFHVKKVSLPLFVAYWVGLIVVVAAVGAIWGF